MSRRLCTHKNEQPNYFYSFIDESVYFLEDGTIIIKTEIRDKIGLEEKYEDEFFIVLA
jgi:hypothetical protein